MLLIMLSGAYTGICPKGDNKGLCPSWGAEYS